MRQIIGWKLNKLIYDIIEINGYICIDRDIFITK